MIRLCPSAAPIGSAMTRAITSVVDPALKGTITRIGFAGQLCAKALRDIAVVVAAAAALHRRKSRRVVTLVSSRLFARLCRSCVDQARVLQRGGYGHSAQPGR